MLRLIRNLIIVVALVLGIAFGFYNYQPVSVDLLFTGTQAPLVVLLAIAFVVGLVVALLVCMVRIASLKRQLSSSRRRLKDSQAEISNLRSTPVHNA